MERMFEPFVTDKERGTGLGLAISRRIVEQHGGKLTAANREGSGAVFTVELPLSAQRLPVNGDRCRSPTAAPRDSSGQATSIAYVVECSRSSKDRESCQVFYTGYQKTLVDAFFHEQDQQLLKAFHERMEKMDRRSPVNPSERHFRRGSLGSPDRTGHRAGDIGGH